MDPNEVKSQPVIEPGALVGLKSGGPSMVVAGIEHIQREGGREVMVRVHWLTVDGTPYTMLYPPAVLKPW